MSSKSHIRQLEEKITALSAALAKLGKGTGLQELLKIIHFPGYTTPAELALTLAILDGMSAQVRALGNMENQPWPAADKSSRPGARPLKARRDLQTG